jgi:DNA-binding transcriptional ArsR family regulator
VICVKAVKSISDPEAFKILADDSRRKIVFLLRAKEMTVSQIADELNLTPQTVYHHIKKLVDADMVEVTREVRIDHLIESYYMATAEIFEITVGKASGSKERQTENIAAILAALKKIGFNLKYNEKDVDKLSELAMEREECCSAKEYEEAVSRLEDADFFVKQGVQEYAGLLSMTDERLEKQDDINRKFREMLRSLVK